MSLDLSTQCILATWDQLSQQLEQFLAAWQTGEPPALGPFLPAEPLALRRMVLIELVKADMEERATRGLAPRVDRYGEEFPELLEHGELPCDLIFEEFHLRRAQGDDAQPAEYLERFPRQAEQLRRLLAIDAHETSTALVPRKKLDDLEPGQRVDDFELLARLGQGAFASVFLARQVSLQRLVALKISADRGSEPQTLAQLDHAHIVRVFDQRQLPARQLRLLYMQYVPGGTLQDVVERVQKTPAAARSGQLVLAAVDLALARARQFALDETPARRRLRQTPWPEVVCRLGAQLALALDYAHRQQVLHRDVKPANVLLSGDGAPKLADFNISFCAQVEGATPAAYFGGSLAYMSPEQLEACNPSHPRSVEELDGRSDLYSLAVLLWELLHGQRPFADERLAGGWTASLEEMTRRRRESRPQSPVPSPGAAAAAELERVLRRTLDPDPRRRPQDGAELARELLLCLQPRAQRLLAGATAGWRRIAQRRPILALLAVILPPNLLAGAFNYWYNKQEIINRLQDAQQTFWYVQAIINAVAYPLGILVLGALAWPLARALGEVNRGQSPASDALAAVRRLALRFGNYAAALGIAEWLAAGLAYPVAMHAALGHFPSSGYLHFLLSLAVCGLVAAAYPFFGCAYLAVRVFYPALLAGAVEPAEVKQLAALGRQAGAYLLIAGGVPLLALLLLAVSGSDNRLASIILILAGAAGLVIAWFTHTALRDDLAALAVALQPTEAWGGASETVDGL